MNLLKVTGSEKEDTAKKLKSLLELDEIKNLLHSNDTAEDLAIILDGKVDNFFLSI